MTDSIQRYDEADMYDAGIAKCDHGYYVTYDDHMAAVQAAVEAAGQAAVQAYILARIGTVTGLQ